MFAARRSKDAVAAVGCLFLLPACTSQSAGTDPDPSAGNEPRIVFEDVTEEMGIPTEETRSWGSLWGDFNGDGATPDLFVHRHARPPWVLTRAGDSFELQGKLPYYPSYMDRHGCAWGEANGDGRPDLFCSQGADAGKGSGRSQLFIHTEQGLVDEADSFGVTDPSGRGRTANWLDHDGDGDLDLFLGNKRRAEQTNHMFENTGDGFVPADVGVDDQLVTVNSTWADWDTDGDPDLLVLQYPPHPMVAYENEGGRFHRSQIGPAPERSWASAAWGDFDGDGDPDLHLVGEERSVVLRNEGGRFSVAHRTSLSFGRMSTWIDVDNDGLLDIFVVQGDARRVEAASGNRPDFFLLQQGEGEFRRVEGPSYSGPEAGFGDAVSVADFDRDGRLDLFVTNGHGHRPASGTSHLLRNRSRAGNWLALALQGDRFNPYGYGATVKLETADVSYERQVTDAFNLRSQNEPGYVHLGLGAASEATIEVSWPDGAKDCLHAPSGRVVAVEKGDDPC